MKLSRKLYLVVLPLLLVSFVAQGGGAEAATQYAACKSMAPFAHRGLWSTSAGIDENTVAAFTRAADNQVHAETDVWVAADGTPVVMHDRNARRTTGVNKFVTDMTAAEFRNLRTIPNGNKVPTFYDLVSAMKERGTIIRIEVKGAPAEWTPEAIGRFATTLRNNNHKENSYQVYSHSLTVLKQFEAEVPALKSIWKIHEHFDIPEDRQRLLDNNVNGVIATPSQISTADTLTLRSQGFIVGARLATDDIPYWQNATKHGGYGSIMTGHALQYKAWCNAQQ